MIVLHPKQNHTRLEYATDRLDQAFYQPNSSMCQDHEDR